jgi:carbon-monoxide dehydrogenase iron sulfur subunit
MKPILCINTSKCVGCHQCELACSLEKKKRFEPWSALIRVERSNTTYGIRLHACRSCRKPPCVDACAFSAIKVDRNLGTPIIDRISCLGCGICADVCPYGAIWIEADEEIAVKCDLCKGDPSCVKVCPTGALSKKGVREE